MALVLVSLVWHLGWDFVFFWFGFFWFLWCLCFGSPPRVCYFWFRCLWFLWFLGFLGFVGFLGLGLPWKFHNWDPWCGFPSVFDFSEVARSGAVRDR